MRRISRILFFSLIIFCSVQVFSQAGSPASDTSNAVLTEVEEMPEFPGGYEGLAEYIKKNIKYPGSCRKDGIEGKVYVSFIVEKDGSLSGIEVMDKRNVANPDLRNEALRVVKKMPGFKPGKVLKNPVRVKMVLPISFKLQ